MGFLVLLAAMIVARIVWGYLAPRSRPQHRGVYISESYRRRIASAASDYQTRSEFAASRRML
jgi:hypothetical protein